MLDLAADRIRSFGPWPDRSPVLLACSGGADSTFLALAWLHTVRESAVSEQEKLPDTVVVVVDHGHRPGSDKDAEAAAAIYRDLDFDVQIKHAHADPDANEAELRSARYTALLESAERHSAKRILLAHHADDNAETVLMRILRGTGLPGLAGIPPRRMLSPDVEIMRPLLRLRGGDMRKALKAMDQPWVEDLSNADPSVATRNLLRHEIIPSLAAASTGDPVSALLRLSAEAVEWEEAKAELLVTTADFCRLPSYLRRQAIRDELRKAGATVSPTRLRNLDQALLSRGTAGIDQHHQLQLQAGHLKTIKS
ncbi:MAG: tRNA lysidine(34) synthetase TilS [Planctomycetes bacterium]|nr:tRNA lysidine(34) synthetase TilS [Planctomycetota bacterium]MCP4770390.1 tRNA lysidine(34) synthetase TilS [Planctomycetota bacterium]MCP4860518.1 tRNA lysidine(34) synthetase TilS [Planctomycetota bacterium]